MVYSIEFVSNKLSKKNFGKKNQDYRHHHHHHHLKRELKLVRQNNNKFQVLEIQRAKE